ncbi:MAG: hypothetical protein DYG98_25330 [Haliscomenobacteraceae bacterium CHB4]|nr:hypothetical protein [Haliscomenobacteraceae bacterium CHB4]
MKTTRLITVFLMTAMWLPATAQQQLKVKHGCAYKTATEDATLFTFDPSDEARRIVGEICNALGLGQNFDLRASSVENALATSEGNRRIILYSNVFLKKFNEEARTRWAAYSVLAHEIGHHFNNHDFNEANPDRRKKMELEADIFSGSILRLLNATLDEAKAGIGTFALDAEQQYHPSARARREAVVSGWTQQQERLEKMGFGTNTNPSTGLPRERDTDGDGIPDKDDACPKEFGPHSTVGCPDSDEDGVPDYVDACVHLKGPASWNGCPDSDGDSIPNHKDNCPDEPGDVVDKGCQPPDRDADGVYDRADKCPDTYGLRRFQGCPDTDGDGVPDTDDKCPKEKGNPLYGGCLSSLKAKEVFEDTSEVKPNIFDRLFGRKPESEMNPEFVFVKGGAFTMGCVDWRDKICADNEKPAHRVVVNDFYIGKYEVTNAEYAQFLNEKGNQSEGDTTWINLNGASGIIKKEDGKFAPAPNRENYPVVEVSWYGAKAYCQWISQKSGHKYRLPTEAEWEYAARGGSLSRGYAYSGSNTLSEVGRYFNNTTRKSTLKANELGLYDMSGSVWEWCNDRYDAEFYKSSPTNDPKGPRKGIRRVVRGGSINHRPDYCRSASRYSLNPSLHQFDVGFRLAR